MTDAPGARRGGAGLVVSALERWPVHPVLFALFPVLYLWSRNTSEVVPGDVATVLVRVLGGAAIVLGVLALAYRHVRRAALLTSAIAVGVLFYGRVAGGVPPAVGLAGLAALVALVALLAGRLSDGAIAALTSGANVLALVLVATTLLPLGGELLAGDAAATSDAGSAGAADAPTRDLYYVILDRYGREDTLRDLFDHDNRPFLEVLEGHGFDVLDGSLANYPKTAHSLAASLNLTYLDELERSVGPDDQDDYEPVYRMLRDHRLGRLLTDIGYEYLHLGTWWGPTASSASADQVLTYDQRSEFEQVFDVTTALPAVRQVLGVDGALDARELRRRHSEHQLDVLEQLARDDGTHAPRFVFAHITLPHEPYVFDVDGSYVTADEEASRSREENYARQLRYLNGRLEEIVEELVADAPAGREPIVILQADEGPTPVRSEELDWEYSWVDAPDVELREKLRIFNAVHLPGVTDEEVAEDLTPVNVLRFILDRYAGAGLGQLEDRAYVYPRRAELYRFVDVTDRVR